MAPYKPLSLLNFKMFEGQNVLVTGGTGTFGQAFVKFCLENFSPKKLVIYSRDEAKQYEMAKVFSEEKYPMLRYFIGDVRDLERLKLSFRDIDFVVHAAAMKHVTAAEYNPTECIKTNVFGAENVVHAAMFCGVQKVIALSTDKASNPVNLYGASKLASDKIFIAANSLSGTIGTRFSVVRYGNVLGSRGSIVPLLRNLQKVGSKTAPVTDRRMTRFIIKIEDGVRFVINSFEKMQGGEVFVPKLPSVRIVDLVEAILPDAKIELIGIRPGEKLHESMISSDEGRMAVEFEDYFVVEPQQSTWAFKSHKEKGGKVISDSFFYDSESNQHYLSVQEIKDALSDAAL